MMWIGCLWASAPVSPRSADGLSAAFLDASHFLPTTMHLLHSPARLPVRPLSMSWQAICLREWQPRHSTVPDEGVNHVGWRYSCDNGGKHDKFIFNIR